MPTHPNRPCSGRPLRCLAALALALPHALPLAADASTATFRPLVRLTGTEGVYQGLTPAKDILVLNGTIYATTQSGGKEDGDPKYAQYEYLYRQWGRLLSYTDPGSGEATNFTSRDASSAGTDGQDLGAGLQYFAQDSNGRIVGTRRHFTGGLMGMGLEAQRSGMVTWSPASTASPLLHLLEHVTPTRTRTAFSAKPGGLWTADKDGNVYGSIYMHGSDAGEYANNTGIYRINAANELHSVAPFLTTAVYGEPALQRITVGDTTYVVHPHGYALNAIVFSEDQGGTLYTLSGIHDASMPRWNGHYPNTSIPEGDTASAAIVSIKLSSLNAVDLRALSLTPKTTLQSLARVRDGLLRSTYSESGNHLDQPSALVEVGDYLYGTTVDTLWRYRKRDANGAAIVDGPIEPLHRFGSEKDGAIPQGRLVLGVDGYLYGTTYEGGEHAHGTLFRIQAGQDNLEQERASYAVVHAFEASRDGRRPLGLNAGPLGSDGKSQTLYGATQEGGNGTSDTHAGYGTFFALDIALADAPVTPGKPSTILIEQFTVNDQASLSVSPGASLRFVWASSNANMCTVDGENIAPGSGGLPMGNGSQSVTAPQAEGSYTYTLSCVNTSVSLDDIGQAKVIVTVVRDTAAGPGEPGTESPTPAQPQDPGPELGGGGTAPLFALASLLAGLLLRGVRTGAQLQRHRRHHDAQA